MFYGCCMTAQRLQASTGRVQTTTL
uniref:Uncharacterized protein n=1 Tax=Arundo donax TaxID=35708 RepID=A0A0A9GZM8_ARUDO